MKKNESEQLSSSLGSTVIFIFWKKNERSRIVKQKSSQVKKSQKSKKKVQRERKTWLCLLYFHLYVYEEEWVRTVIFISIIYEVESSSSLGRVVRTVDHDDDQDDHNDDQDDNDDYQDNHDEDQDNDQGDWDDNQDDQYNDQDDHHDQYND